MAGHLPQFSGIITYYHLNLSYRREKSFQNNQNGTKSKSTQQLNIVSSKSSPHQLKLTQENYSRPFLIKRVLIATNIQNRLPQIIKVMHLLAADHFNLAAADHLIKVLDPLIPTTWKILKAVAGSSKDDEVAPLP